MRLGLLIRRMALGWTLSRRQRVDFGAPRLTYKNEVITFFYSIRRERLKTDNSRINCNCRRGFEEELHGGTQPDFSHQFF